MSVLHMLTGHVLAAFEIRIVAITHLVMPRRIPIMWSTTFVSLLVLLFASYAYASPKCIPAVNVTCPELCECQLCGEQLRLNIDCWKIKTAKLLRKAVKQMPTETNRLYIGWNQLSQIFNETFSHLTNLTKLYIDHNKLDGNLIHLAAFKGLGKLNYLIMGNNPHPGLLKLRREWLKPLASLTKFDFQFNNLDKIDENIFVNNNDLEWIIFNNNNLKAIPASLFQNMTNLNGLFLHRNDLSHLPPGMLNGTDQLTRLNIAHNKLRTISPDIGLQNLESLKQLHVYGNPLDCGCDLIWFRNWIDTTDIVWDINNVNCSDGRNILKFNPDDLRCEFPVIMVTTVSVAASIVLCAIIVSLRANRWRIRYGIFVFKRRFKVNKYEEIKDDDDEFKYDVFLSHSSKDEEWVLKVLHPTLENPPYNYKLCLDYRDFIIGDTIADNIIDAVQKSRKTAFILTKSFIESEWCYFELEMVRQQMFDEHRDLAILIMKENVSTGDMPGLLKYLMRKGNYIEWSDNKHGELLFWSKLDSALKCTKTNMV
ncbi:uncharacterized protein LOC100371103 [Saccoglossus kowalevskii]|uniref:Toll-like receptor 13-like n=1 Tax=Saccoglossus kowalevskii TaxID=10224 RepID=A0ABM0GNM7_SACKO|nr:PREDICTED: toll-like receptor 13-like [Saccoglossus kowalevskii]